MAVDPMAEASESVSVYHYAGNNPIMFNDPNGDYQTNPFSPGFNQQVGNVWTNPNVNMGPTAGGLNPNLNYGGATGAGDNIFYYQLLAAASGGSAEAWKQYAAIKGGQKIYQTYGNGKSTGVSKGSLRDYMEDIHINGIDPTGVTMLAEVTIKEAGWKIQAEAYGSQFYSSSEQGGGNWFSNAWGWVKKHFYASADYQVSEGPQFDVGIKRGVSVTIVPSAQILSEGHVDNRGGSYYYNGFNKNLGSMDAKQKTEFGGSYYAGADYLHDWNSGQSTLSVGGYGFLGASVSWDANGITNWYFGIDVSAHGAIIFGGSGEVKLGFGK